MTPAATPIITMGGATLHRVAYLWDDDTARTHCGLRMGDAAYLISTARTLLRTPPCQSCDRSLRRNP